MKKIKLNKSDFLTLSCFLLFGIDDMALALVGSAIVGGITSAISNKKNRKSVSANNARIEERQDNALQRARSDAEKAGFSPWSVAGTNGASSGGTVASTADYSGLTNSLQQLTSGLQAQEQIKIAKEQAKDNHLIMTQQKKLIEEQVKAQREENRIRQHNLKYAVKNNLPYGSQVGLENQILGLASNVLGSQDDIGRVIKGLLFGSSDKTLSGEFINKLYGNKVIDPNSNLSIPDQLSNHAKSMLPGPNIFNWKGIKGESVRNRKDYRNPYPESPSQSNGQSYHFNNKSSDWKTSNVYDQSSYNKGYVYSRGKK